LKNNINHFNGYEEMSSSSARAKQRRANIQPPVQETPPVQQTATRGGMTLPQVLQLVDSRITNLERIAKESMDSPPDPPKLGVDESWRDILKEYDTRFTMLVTEINNLKDIVIKLQSYTMDVNKTLLEERVHLMGNISEVKEEIIMTESATDPIQMVTDETEDSEESEERIINSDNEESSDL
jgi:hypothetical protein